ncbi:TPA: fimbria/pilus periplasmic chaperone [Serratia fonticola]|uniref:fimbria/pilus periplasmic chaperone n=1 Tax=Serratia fonticola TaxID=47917 RepID=UPI002178D1B1|nr:fimbria/pilus periplasmic chaperone [Serratia fonticola]CAI1674717.1 Chaperone protein focC precursor [Serratia fonticola]CAI1681891.1 Chaperone protein focC precursor [Serratia fonticola]CAI1914039.1 Chaperone protein focC precursor [Serratia fonticola]CAI2033454.1 Chaperone protein focC precursor [Serratia fonticola]
MRFPFQNILRVVGLAVVALFSTHSLASIVINGTRVIYPSDQKEVSVRLDNTGNSPVLIQSWLDTGDINAKPAAIKVPFILSPPINRVEGGKGQTLRISYSGGSLPMDKESVFWLNVLEVPAKKQAKSDENYLQMAFRSRIKVFYRPAGLAGNANDAAQAVTWSIKGSSLQAFNPTPYYVSFVSLTVNGKKIEGEMVAPRSALTLAIPANKGNTVSGEFVNDYGAINSFNAVIK